MRGGHGVSTVRGCSPLTQTHLFVFSVRGHDTGGSDTLRRIDDSEGRVRRRKDKHLKEQSVLTSCCSWKEWIEQRNRVGKKSKKRNENGRYERGMYEWGIKKPHILSVDAGVAVVLNQPLVESRRIRSAVAPDLFGGKGKEAWVGHSPFSLRRD